MISPDKKFVSINELKQKGYSYYRIAKLEEQKIIKKVTKSLYENLIYKGEESDFYYVPAYAKRGVVCLTSAAVYWHLSTDRPLSLDVAIPKKARVYTLPSWPRFTLFYFDEPRYSVGKTLIIEGENGFSIYDIEKTVLDTLAYREKVGIEMFKTVMTNYLAMQNRDLDKLYEYAKLLNSMNILRTYLDVLL